MRYPLTLFCSKIMSNVDEFVSNTLDSKWAMAIISDSVFSLECPIGIPIVSPSDPITDGKLV